MVFVPLPPSANRMHVLVRRRGKASVARSAAYRRWLAAAVPLMRAGLDSQPPRVPLAVTIVAAIDRRRDLDNVLKCLVDALQEAGVVPDDRWVDSIHATRAAGEGAGVSVAALN